MHEQVQPVTAWTCNEAERSNFALFNKMADHVEKRLFQIALQNDRVFQLSASHGGWMGPLRFALATMRVRVRDSGSRRNWPSAVKRIQRSKSLSCARHTRRQEKAIANIKEVPEPTGLQPLFGSE